VWGGGDGGGVNGNRDFPLSKDKLKRFEKASFIEKMRGERGKRSPAVVGKSFKKVCGKLIFAM